MLLWFSVVIEPYYMFWQVKQPILIFIFDYYVIVTDVIAIRPDVLRPILFILSLWFMML